MSVSILVVDDEPDVAELFRQRFRRETRQGTYVLHYATSGWRRWIGSRVKSSPRWSRSSPTSICPEWTGCSYSVRSSSAFPTCPS